MYTKPKKSKHKHTTVKLRVLKLYKVSDDGKVSWSSLTLRTHVSLLPTIVEVICCLSWAFDLIIINTHVLSNLLSCHQQTILLTILIIQVTRLNKMSPAAPGCFMARHFDRWTCGKSGLTYMFSDNKE